MNTFKDVKNLMKLRKEAKAIQKKLSNIHIESESGPVVVTINGEQKVVKVEIQIEGLDPKIKRTLEDALVIAFNKGVKKSQEIAAENMKDILGQLGGGMPGMDAALPDAT